jgi:protein ImuB
MLWLALCLPSLALEARLRGHARFELEPWAIAEKRAVFACNASAHGLGVRPGMGLAAAWAVAPGLQSLPRDQHAERRALQAIAGWLCRFTPGISLQPPQGVLAEIEGSLRLFGGLERLAGDVRSGLAGMGFAARLAAAPTARGAWWLALAGVETLIEAPAELQPALAALPVEVLECGPAALELLGHLGIATLGELMRLPREGLAHRFGQRLLRDLDRALGRCPEPRELHVPPACFASGLELPAPLHEAGAVLFAARRLLGELEGFLAARHAGVRRFTLEFVHHGRAPSQARVNLAAPGRDAEHFARLLRERLETFALPAPAQAIGLRATGLVPLPGMTAELFRDAHAGGEEWLRFVERLQARFGGEAVHGLALRAEHRPERAWQAVAVGAGAPGVGVVPGPRPLWLLDAPRRIEEGGLALLAGPERIESGWWDGDEARRDYFIARTGSGSLVWIYRERAGGWFLHGIFA